MDNGARALPGYRAELITKCGDGSPHFDIRRRRKVKAPGLRCVDAELVARIRPGSGRLQPADDHGAQARNLPVPGVRVLHDFGAVEGRAQDGRVRDLALELAGNARAY